MNIVLVGFMGTGKTTIAKKLARRLAMVYVSTDDLIEQDTKMSISDIFEKKGEAYFRDAEVKAVKKASAMKNAVIDAGGGAVINPENAADLKRTGVMICLWADAQDIYARTRRYTHRPLLKVGNPIEKIQDLLNRRKPYYERADHHINTSVLAVDDVVNDIVKLAQKI
ncbi:MAG: shikimate kinase [Candidatus Omnitrophica bacterium]|nr:shikimate kinase [Candidatus Omnitrophota bacterium]